MGVGQRGRGDRNHHDIRPPLMIAPFWLSLVALSQNGGLKPARLEDKL